MRNNILEQLELPIVPVCYSVIAWCASQRLSNHRLVCFSAMSAAHSKLRSELSHAQFLAHLMIGFNGPSVPDFRARLDIKSRQPKWPLYIHPNSFNYICTITI